MACFEQAVDYVLSWEGGFANNENDRGGATNFGISLRFLKSLPTERLRIYGIFEQVEEIKIDTIKELTLDQAKLMYKNEFWDIAPFERIISQEVANYMFDCAVLHGINPAIKMVQHIFYPPIIDDGILGNKTLNRINATTSYYFLGSISNERAYYMRNIVSQHPKDKDFVDGWLRRCYQIR